MGRQLQCDHLGHGHCRCDLRHREHLSPGGVVNTCCVYVLTLGISSHLSQPLPPVAIKLIAAGSMVDIEPGLQHHWEPGRVVGWPERGTWNLVRLVRVLVLVLSGLTFLIYTRGRMPYTVVLRMKELIMKTAEQIEKRQQSGKLRLFSCHVQCAREMNSGHLYKG